MGRGPVRVDHRWAGQDDRRRVHRGRLRGGQLQRRRRDKASYWPGGSAELGSQRQRLRLPGLLAAALHQSNNRQCDLPWFRMGRRCDCSHERPERIRRAKRRLLADVRRSRARTLLWSTPRQLHQQCQPRRSCLVRLRRNHNVARLQPGRSRLARVLLATQHHGRRRPHRAVLHGGQAHV